MGIIPAGFRSLVETDLRQEPEAVDWFRMMSTSENPVVHTENSLNAGLVVAHQRVFG